jgi:hypothetical protein
MLTVPLMMPGRPARSVVVPVTTLWSPASTAGEVGCKRRSPPAGMRSVGVGRRIWMNSEAAERARAA